MAHGDEREGKWRGNWRMEWVASTLYTTSENGVSSITTADAHTSAASSRLNWRPRRFKWNLPFRRKTKSVSARVPSHFKHSLPLRLRNEEQWDGRSMWRAPERTETYTGILWRNVEDIDSFKNTGLYWTIILKWMKNKSDRRSWTGFICLWIRTKKQAVVTAVMNLRVAYTMRDI